MFGYTPLLKATVDGNSASPLVRDLISMCGLPVAIFRYEATVDIGQRGKMRRPEKRAKPCFD